VITILLILLVLWFIGYGPLGLGPIIHLLLALVLILAVVELIGRSRPPGGDLP
jgi:hypothetical protein